MSFYIWFVKNYAYIVGPLMDLLLSSSLAWSTTTQSTFESLKHAIAQLPVLLFSDFTLPFDVTTDASQIVMAAQFSQQDRPIALFTKKLSPQLQVSSTYVRKLYAVTETVKKWRQ
ncbi:hypothetical protein Sango_1936300 [Sesamum angolense]|uniref:Reverse transcriptase/retrotransposon-derived protein RNase H-like domain-containing protein n=1 Tax=Sesamum angolense TaxID=2727404 RepID=A0AAE1WE02_9LAMI|nr:hypothetical protein Sango_1936300 [Sesamum angolense]